MTTTTTTNQVKKTIVNSKEIIKIEYSCTIKNVDQTNKDNLMEIDVQIIPPVFTTLGYPSHTMYQTNTIHVVVNKDCSLELFPELNFGGYDINKHRTHQLGVHDVHTVGVTCQRLYDMISNQVQKQLQYNKEEVETITDGNFIKLQNNQIIHIKSIPDLVSTLKTLEPYTYIEGVEIQTYPNYDLEVLKYITKYNTNHYVVELLEDIETVIDQTNGDMCLASDILPQLENRVENLRDCRMFHILDELSIKKEILIENQPSIIKYLEHIDINKYWDENYDWKKYTMVTAVDSYGEIFGYILYM